MSVASSVYLSSLSAEGHTLSTKSLGAVGRRLVLGQMLSCPVAGQQIQPQSLNFHLSSAHPHFCHPSPAPPQHPRWGLGELGGAG